LHLVWCPKYRRRVLGGRVAARCGELVEQIAAENGWEIVAKEVMPASVGYVSESTVRRCIEHQCDVVA
jgi:putative transposase